MKILITGGSGFLGRRAAAFFSALGHQVLVPSHAQLDIKNNSAVEDWFQRQHPDAVIHCAAISNTGLCQKKPEWSHEINVTGSLNLATACNQCGAKFVFCSSDQVYHASALPGPHFESEKLTPVTAYASQKLQAEQLCQAVCPNTVNLRLSWMYSDQFLPGEHGHLLLSLRDALQEKTIPIVRSPYDFRGVTDVESVVQNLPAALNLPAGVYNFGAENNLDMYHTLQTVFSNLGLQDALHRLSPDETAQPRDIRMDGSLAASYGISFESTVDGLYRALSSCI